MEARNYDAAIASLTSGYDLAFRLRIPEQQQLIDGFADVLASAYRHRGVERYENQETDGAIADFLKAIEIDAVPLDYYNLALGYRRFGVAIYRQDDAFSTDANLQGMIINFDFAIENYELFLEHAAAPGANVDSSVVEEAQTSLRGSAILLRLSEQS
jgi:tetratricopeptide (TPR) repeat protein